MKQKIFIRVCLIALLSCSTVSVRAENLEFLYTVTTAFSGSPTNGLLGAGPYTMPTGVDSTYVGFVWFPLGFTIGNGQAAGLNVFPPVGGTINLNDGKLTLTGDLLLTSTAMITGDGTVDGNDNAIILTDDMTINSQLRFSSDTVIQGNNNTITLGAGAELLINNNVTVTLQNVVVKDLDDTGPSKITMEGTGSELALDNVHVWLDGHYSHTQGSIFVHNDVTISGSTWAFTHKSNEGVYIAKQSQLKVDHGVSLSYDVAGQDDRLYMAEQTTSRLYLNGCFLRSRGGGTGMTLKDGTVIFDSLVTLSADGQNPGEAMIFGDNNNVTLTILPRSNIQAYGYIEIDGTTHFQGTQSHFIFMDESAVIDTINNIQTFCSDNRFVKRSEKTINAYTFDYNAASTFLCELVVSNSDWIDQNGALVETNSDAITHNWQLTVANSDWVDQFGPLVVTNSIAINHNWDLTVANSEWIDQNDAVSADLYELEAKMDFIDTWSVTFDHGPGDIDVNTTTTNLIYDLWLSKHHKLNIAAAGTVNFDGDTHFIHFARESKDPSGPDPMITIAGGDTLNLTNVVLKDFSPGYIGPETGPSIFFGDATTIEMTDNEMIDPNYTMSINGKVTINCFGNKLDLSEREIAIDILPSSTLVLLNTHLIGLEDYNLRCLGDDATLTMSNCILQLDYNYSFTQGHMNIYQDVVVTGTKIFTYHSPQPCTIHPHARLMFELGSTFSYDGNVRKDSIVMIDKTSQLSLRGCTLHVTTTGLQLTKGTLVIDHIVELASEAEFVSLVEAEKSGGITFGNAGTGPEENINIEIMPGGSIQLNSGYLNWENEIVP